MKRFFKNIFILFIVVVMAVGIIITAGFRNDKFVGGIVDKIELVKNTMKSDKKRIILIGGSNVAFGINSQLIQEELNDEYEIINFGVHAGAGLKYYLDIVKPYVKDNDIIVLLPEYEHFFNESFYGGDVLIEMIEFYPQSIKTLSFKQIKGMANNFNLYLFSDKIKRLLEHEVDPPNYKRFNEKGDLISHLDKEGIDITKLDKILNGKREYNSNAISYINSFSKELETKNVKVVFDFPPIPENMYEVEPYNLIQEKLYSDLDIEIIGDKENYIYPANYFYDTCYHLLKEGREIRSNQLAEDIKNYLK